MKVKELIALLELADSEAIVRVAKVDWRTHDGEMKALENIDKMDFTRYDGTKTVDLS